MQSISLLGEGSGENFKWKLKGEDVELPDVKNSKIDYVKRPRDEYTALRNKFNSSVRKDFMKTLGSDPDALRAAGFTEAEILKIQSGGVPPGWNVHHKLPLDDSGTNDFGNLVLIKNDPYHYVITNYQNDITSGFDIGDLNEVDWPEIEGSIYPKKK